MAAIKISGFGGMLPALDDRLLPNHQAAQAENLWSYSGALIGLPTLKVLHVMDNPAATKIYRIPNLYTRPDDFDDSLWLEFENAFTDVIRAPVVSDTYDRYYWAASSSPPMYNTRARIEYSLTPVSNTVTFTNATELVNWTAHPLEIGDKIRFSNSGGALPTGIAALTDYYVATTSFGANSFRISTTLNGAINGTALVTFTTDGTGTNTLTTQEHQAWILGIPVPAAPTLNVVGGVAAVVARSYVCTWVTAYGEEGPASAPVSATDNPDGSWDLTLPTPDSDDLGIDRYLTKVRIYRTVTSASGVATYFFVAEQNINDTTYSDTLSDEVVSANDQLESTAWTAPPTDLEGWVLMPNGMVVGWRNNLNEIWFSEPYRPHAWPARYVLAVEYPIVGLGVVNQTLVVATRGFPMTGTGVSPSTFSTSKLANFEPCVSRGSIASAPEGVYYASPNGLVRVVPGKATNITSNLVTKDRWNQLTFVSALKIARLGTAIYAFGSARTEIFNDEAFQTNAFEQEDLTGAQAGVLLDVMNERVALGVLTSADNTLNVYNDAWTGEVFIVRSGIVYWIDQIDPLAPLDPYLWRSKVFQMDFKKNLGAMKVYFEVPEQTPAQGVTRDNTLVQNLDTDQYGLVRVYADGVHVATRELRESGELLRLPSGFKADYWQFEVEARVRIFSIHAASTAKELARV